MTTSINWNNIRPQGNGLADGFEELICQLAFREFDSNAKTFHRIGKPDAGKECYWELNNGDLIMWQAKYFLNSPSASQWTQIDKSVKTAINKHNRIVKYFVSLPVDLPDAKVTDTESALEKWKRHVTKWEKLALAKDMTIEFVYWGSSDLIHRLSKKENEGMTYFWFNREELTDEWFNQKNNESINALGARYSPELNVELAISKLTEGLSRSNALQQYSDNLYREFYSNYRKALRAIDFPETTETMSEINDIVKIINSEYLNIVFSGNNKINDSAFLENLILVLKKNNEITNVLYTLRNDKEKANRVTSYTRPLNQEIDAIHSFIRSTRNLTDFFKRDIIYLAKNPFLLLTGEAGIGKSHLLADMVTLRKKLGQTSLLLLGENFSNKDLPWTQILNNQLRKSTIDEHLLLGALNAKAESMRSRIIIFIDALNEGEGRFIWPRNLKSFIELIQKHRWLGLVISIRDTYLDLIAPQNDITNDIILRVEHEGFADNEYEATKHFFKQYGITLPSAPILNPEFHNPLFLKLFCKSLYTNGHTEIPPGYDGISKIFEFYLDAVNHKLALPDELDYDERKKLVHLTIRNTVKKMLKSGQDFLTYKEAGKITDKIFAGKCGNIKQYLPVLISEGIFNIDLHWDTKGKHFDVVYFGYQRFQDHLLTTALLDQVLDIQNPDEAFKTGRLSEIFKDNFSTADNRNLVEALAIQIPERTGKELFELIPKIKKFRPLGYSWINSLLWRNPQSIGKAAVNYVNTVIVRDEYLFTAFLNLVISGSMKFDFRFNADSLHTFLLNQKLADRDSFWTIWLQDKYGEDSEANAVTRLIDWSWNEDNKSFVSNEALILASTTLGWFLTSTNRSLRDAATKALVCLFQDRLTLIPKILKKFEDVNDPYIVERLYAAAYGAILRSENYGDIEEVANYIYSSIFDKDLVCPHILIRDYARQTIEYSLLQGIKFQGNIDNIRPPYKSKQLPKKLPTNVQIDKKYKPKNDDGKYNSLKWGSTAILSSMTTEYGRGTMGYGDFGRYVFQRALDEWNVDYDGLSNLAVQRIFEMGYNPDTFSKFDNEQGSGRDGSSNERIGKKYQWIVFHQILAQVSDQKELIDFDAETSKRAVFFEGPWHPNVRDIDPSIIIKETKSVDYKQSPFHWWFTEHHLNLNQSNKLWLKSTEDIPNLVNHIQVTDSLGNEWLWLDNNPLWIEKEPLDADTHYSPRKRLSAWIAAYIVRKKEKESLLKNINNNLKRDLPNIRTMHTIFSREYYWSPAFTYFQKPYFSGQEWIELYNKKGDACGKVHRTSEYFLWEEEFDYSKTETIAYHKPTKLLFEGLKMKFSKLEGEFNDHDGNLICFDPSVYNETTRGMLVRKDALLKYLEECDLEIIWSVTAEKIILGNSKSKDDYGRLIMAGNFELVEQNLKGTISVVPQKQ